MAEDKKGGLLAIIAGGPPRGGSRMGGSMSEDKPGSSSAEPYGDTPSEMPEKEESGGDVAFRAVARAFGIPAERQADAQEALHEYVRACVRDGDDYEG